MATMTLSRGAIVQILNGQTPDSPTFQLINARKIGSSASNNAVDRYRLIVSDGEYMYSHVMLPAQHNHLIENGSMENFAIIKVNKYLCNIVNNDRKVLILLDVTVVTKGKLTWFINNGNGPGYSRQFGSAPLGENYQAAHCHRQSEAGSCVGDRIGEPVQINPTQIPSLSDIQSQSGNTDRPGAVNGAGKPVLQVQNSGPNTGPATTPGKMNKAPTPGTPGSTRVHPIATLTPYQNRWRIRARVTNKSNIKTWNNSRGEGRLFNVNLLDESGEIRCTGFNDQVDQFYNMLEINKVYYISKCTLKTANKQFNHLNCDYEMTMNGETIIESCNDADDMPALTFDFIPLSKLENTKPNSNVDVMGVVKSYKDVVAIMTKASKEVQKRDVTIVDQSGVGVSLTLWGDEAVKFEGDGFPIVALKGARVSDFGGRSLSVGGSTTMLVNPDTKEAHTLRGWYDSEGRNREFSSFQSEGGPSGPTHSSNWKTFLQAKTENLGSGEKADYFTAKGTVVFLKRDNCMYQACPTQDCNKKVVNLGNGLYRCEKCAREFPNFKWRMILNTNLADYSDNQWVTCFQDSAEMMLGMKADELGALREEDEIGFDNVMQEALFKPYIFRLRAKMETYNDENRMKTVCMTANPVNWLDYGNHLVQELVQMGV